MSQLNPFEPPTDKEPTLDSFTARRLLELPDRPPRASFGDYAFYPIVALVGVAITVGFLYFGGLSLWGVGIAAFGFVNWIREARRKG